MNKNEWILKMSEQAFAALSASHDSQLDSYVSYGGRRIVKYYDAERASIGIAFCDPDDSFDFKTGVAIAYAKATKQRLHSAFKIYRYIDIRKLNANDEFYDYAETKNTYRIISKTLDNETGLWVITTKNLDDNMYDVLLIHKNEKYKVQI